MSIVALLRRAADFPAVRNSLQKYMYEVAQDAAHNVSWIIFIEETDSIAFKRERVTCKVAWCIVAQF